MRNIQRWDFYSLARRLAVANIPNSGFVVLSSAPHLFFFLRYALLEALKAHSRVRHVAHADGLVNGSHEAFEGRGYHFGLAVPASAFGQDRVDGEWGQIKGELLLVPFVAEKRCQNLNLYQSGHLVGRASHIFPTSL